MEYASLHIMVSTADEKEIHISELNRRHAFRVHCNALFNYLLLSVRSSFGIPKQKSLISLWEYVILCFLYITIHRVKYGSFTITETFFTPFFTITL